MDSDNHDKIQNLNNCAVDGEAGFWNIALVARQAVHIDIQRLNEIYYMYSVHVVPWHGFYNKGMLRRH